MHRSIFTLVFACVASLLPGAAQAQDIGFYGGVSGSHARLVTAGPSTANHVSTAEFPAPGAPGLIALSTRLSIAEDIRRAGWKAYAGYNFHRFFGVEAAYTHSVRVQTRITSSTTFSSDFTAPGLRLERHVHRSYSEHFGCRAGSGGPVSARWSLGSLW